MPGPAPWHRAPGSAHSAFEGGKWEVTKSPAERICWEQPRQCCCDPHRALLLVGHEGSSPLGHFNRLCHLWIPFAGLELVVTSREHSKRMWKTSEAEEHFSLSTTIPGAEGVSCDSKGECRLCVSESCPTLMGGRARHPTPCRLLVEHCVFSGILSCSDVVNSSVTALHVIV